MVRELKFGDAVREALDIALARDPSVYVMGLGVPDPKGIFGTTLELQEQYGSGRVFDIPTSENAMTGVALGSSLLGMRPVLVHQRVDFATLAMDQMVNQAAKWRYMFGGKQHAPIVIRMIVGRGWGNGPQHTQSLQSWFAHVPGLKVVMPVTPRDAKGLLLAAIDDDDPVVYIEHRWLHHLRGDVPEGHYHVPIGSSQTLRPGTDVTIAAISYSAIEAARAADALAAQGVAVEVIAITSLRPFDPAPLIESVRRTGRLVVADTSWTHAGFSAELVSTVAEHALDALVAPPVRLGLADAPVPTTPALARASYPTDADIVRTVGALLHRDFEGLSVELESARVLHDVPDLSFTGPF